MPHNRCIGVFPLAPWPGKLNKYLPMSVAIHEHISIFRDKINSFLSTVSASRQTIRSVIALLSSNLLTSMLTAFGGLLIGRFVGPEVVGSFRAYTIPLTYLAFLQLGTFDGLGR